MHFSYDAFLPKKVYEEKCSKESYERMSEYECEKSSERESDKTEVQHAFNVETAISATDVTPFCCLADCFQVHSVVGMDNGADAE